ncbi:DNA ligase (NAD+) [Mycoplasmoides fastidiosum]|uniref:DNA ligase n=1 Tax=Mycoplasmoides fastidiosum TaxID=92758 RepID=A0ABU0LYB9_9BACT|nr:NAD-dependent DNA ligase LigA [Mycoplasmoides fastidiosum]MDQ0513706.1 DNA ligase (NAD+) [Mycoplasmoides fastidiosum]UUD37871.1 NAD-dependent DNA ligase LigA [Mycoplasmoides fastidiosum]
MNQKLLKKIEKLKAQINEWNDAYYKGQILVDDEVYDAALRELNLLEKNHGEFLSADSPTQVVGTTAKNVFVKKAHQIPMLSLDNAFDWNELMTFFNNCYKVSAELEGFVLEPKIDGSSISLIYQNNQLVDAVTRGDGVIGESILANVKTIKSIPHHTPNGPGDFEVRGEIFISKSEYEIYKNLTLEKLIKEQQEKIAKQSSNKDFVNKDIKLPTVGNSRNVVAGTLRLLDPNIVAQRPLQAIFYQIIHPQQYNIVTQTQVHAKLMAWGFKTPDQNYTYHSSDLTALEKFITNFGTLKDRLEIPCDGLVVKVNNLNTYEQIGYTSKFPKWAIAFKFPTTIKKTELLNIYPTTGRTGKITYVGDLAPVNINDTIVRSVTLHNAEYIREKDLRIGDLVSVYKSGEIIPKVIGVDFDARKPNAVRWVPDDYCSSCGSELFRSEELVDEFCPNPQCQAKLIGQLTHFCSRNAMNIVGLSEKILMKFIELEIIKDITDIFTIKNHRQLIFDANIQIKDKLFDKLVEAIELAKQNDFAKVIFALGIQHVGQRSAKLIAEKYLTIENLQQATVAELTTIDDIGEKIAEAIVIWFADSKNQIIIEKLIAAGVNFQTKAQPQNGEIETSILTNQNIVITGTFWITRQELAQILIAKFNCQVQDNLNQKTNFLLVGDNPGSKVQKANNKNIPILNELEVKAIINNEQN